MILRLRLTFRILFFYNVMYIVCAGILLYKNFLAMWRKMGSELRVVWHCPTANSNA